MHCATHNTRVNKYDCLSNIFHKQKTKNLQNNLYSHTSFIGIVVSKIEVEGENEKVAGGSGGLA